MERPAEERAGSFRRAHSLIFTLVTSGPTIVPSSLPGSPGPRKTVLLLMLVVACGHFNRVGIAVAGTERIIPGYGIDPAKMGLVYTAFLDILHAGDVSRRLVHRPLRTASGPSAPGLRLRCVRRA